MRRRHRTRAEPPYPTAGDCSLLFPEGLVCEIKHPGPVVGGDAVRFAASDVAEIWTDGVQGVVVRIVLARHSLESKELPGRRSRAAGKIFAVCVHPWTGVEAFDEQVSWGD